MDLSYSLIIVVAPSDARTLLYGLPNIQKYLPVKSIHVIGDQAVRDILEAGHVWNDRVRFLEEDELLGYKEVQEYMRELTGDEACVRRTGWYLQQFLKMKYATICDDPYYIVWDADTIPLQPITLFENNKPVFNMKDEWNPAYFDTMSRIITGLEKLEKDSFIAEHMIINVSVMRELIQEIEDGYYCQQAEKLPFWKVILQSIRPQYLANSGFSEFETYGNYCMLRYPQMYVKKQYDSFRFATRYFVLAEMHEQDFLWIARDYPAVSFEKYAVPVKFYKIFQWPVVQKCVHIDTIVRTVDEIKRFFNRVRNKLRKWFGIK